MIVASPRLRAWVIGMLSIAADANDMGDVVAGLALAGIVMDAAVLGEDGQPLLAVCVCEGAPPASLRTSLAKLGVPEAWLINARSGKATFLQAEINGRLRPVAADRNGVYYAALHQELFFPAAWFGAPPSVWDILSYWQIIDG